MICKHMILLGVDKAVVSQILGQQVPDNVECAMSVCTEGLECASAYCNGSTDEGVCAHYERGSGKMVRVDDV